MMTTCFVPWRMVCLFLTVLLAAPAALAAPAGSRLHIEVRWNTTAPVTFTLIHVGDTAVMSATGTSSTIPNTTVSISAQSGTFDVDPADVRTASGYAIMSSVSGTACAQITRVTTDWYMDGCLTGSFTHDISPCYQPQVGSWHPGNPCLVAQVPEPAFEVTEALPPLERRLLIGAYRPKNVPASDSVYAFSSSRQTEDGQYRITIHGNDASGIPLNGKTAYFRIVDPPEKAPPLISPPHGTATDYYVKTVLQGDNRGAAGSASLSATQVTFVNGVASTDLILAPTAAAGDNYQIEASHNSAFFCVNGCARSGVITAWKRVYVEQKKMFRKGAYIAQTVEPEGNVVRVADVGPLLNLKGNTYAVLIHAPAIDQPRTEDQVFYQTAPLKIVSVSQDAGQITGEVTLDAPVGRKFYGPEIADTVYSADAIGVAGGDSTLYVPNLEYFSKFYESAFLEVRVLPGSYSLVTYFPYDERLDETLGENQHFLSGKWYEHGTAVGGAPTYFPTTLPNHRFFVGAALAASPPGTATPGLANRVGGWAYVYVKFIDSRNSISSANRKRLNGEAAVHEFGHLLRNPHQHNPGTRVAWYTNLNRFCIMQYGGFWFDSQLKPLPESYDGLMEFHFHSDSDSEYLTIRKNPEPLPQY